MRKLWGVTLLAFAIASSGCSSGSEQQRSVQSENLYQLSGAILANNWEDKVGYDRMLVLVGGILKDWRDQGIEVYAVSDDANEEAEIWTQLVLMYFSTKEGRNSSLLEAMEFFLENQEKLKESDNESRIPDIESAQAESGTAGANTLEAKPAEDRTLAEAVSDGKLEEIERLLEQGADPNLTDDYGTPVLLNAIYRADLPSDMPDPDLIEAARRKSLKIVEQLLAHGADPNVQYSEGEPALVAASAYLPDACVPLLKAGADPNAKDRFGETALYHALDDARLFGDLLKHGVDPNSANDEGATVYDLVRERNATEIAKLIGMELKEQKVTPPNEDVGTVFDRVKNGLTPSDALELFGSRPYEFVDELYGTDVWAYAYMDAGLKKPISAQEMVEVNVAEYKASLTLYLYWTADQTLEYCTIYALGPKNKVYGYTVYPGDRKVVGFVM